MAVEEKEVLMHGFRIICRNDKYGLKWCIWENAPDLIKAKKEEIFACEYDFIYPVEIYNPHFLYYGGGDLFIVKQGEYFGYFYTDIFEKDIICYPIYDWIHLMSDSLLMAHADKTLSVVAYREGRVVYQVGYGYDEYDHINGDIIQLGWMQWEGKQEPVLMNIHFGIVHPWKMSFDRSLAEIVHEEGAMVESKNLLFYEHKQRVGVVDQYGQSLMSPKFDRIKVEYKITGYNGKDIQEVLVPLCEDGAIIRRQVDVHIICELELFSDKWCHPKFYIDDIWINNSRQNPNLTLSDCISIALSDLSRQGKRSCVFVPGSSCLFKIPAVEIASQILAGLESYFKADNSFDSVAILCDDSEVYNDYVHVFYMSDNRLEAEGHSSRFRRAFDYVYTHATCDHCDDCNKPAPLDDEYGE